MNCCPHGNDPREGICIDCDVETQERERERSNAEPTIEQILNTLAECGLAIVRDPTSQQWVFRGPYFQQ